MGDRAHPPDELVQRAGEFSLHSNDASETERVLTATNWSYRNQSSHNRDIMAEFNVWDE